MQKNELSDSMKFDKAPDIPIKSKEKLPTVLKRLPSTILNTARTQNDPFYYDEISFSVFTEQFLDYFVEESYKKVMRKRDNQTTKIKILKDVIQLIETDRVVFKFFNQMVMVFMNKKFSSMQSDQPSSFSEIVDQQQQLKLDEDYIKRQSVITFICEATKFLLLSFIKRCKIVI
jgi:hypothetical protein